MIMTKDRTKEDIARWTQDEFESAAGMLSDGLYMISATNDSEHVREMSESSESDYILVGMVVPARKGAAICQLLQDEHGIMQSPVVLLKRASDGEHAESVRSTRPMAPVSETSENIRIRDIEIIPGRHEVRVAGQRVELTFSEFRILQTLAAKPGWVFSRDKIILAVHGDNYNCTERAVDVQVTGLRKKLGHAGDYVETVRGVGYRFVE